MQISGTDPIMLTTATSYPTFEEFNQCVKHAWVDVHVSAVVSDQFTNSNHDAHGAFNFIGVSRKILLTALSRISVTINGIVFLMNASY